MPLIGKRYLLFLKYDPSTDDFHILTGYQLEGQRTYALDELASSASQRHHDAFIHPLRESGHGEETLVIRTRSLDLSSKGNL